LDHRAGDSATYRRTYASAENGTGAELDAKSSSCAGTRQRTADVGRARCDRVSDAGRFGEVGVGQVILEAGESSAGTEAGKPSRF